MTVNKCVLTVYVDVDPAIKLREGDNVYARIITNGTNPSTVIFKEFKIENGEENIKSTFKIGSVSKMYGMQTLLYTTMQDLDINEIHGLYNYVICGGLTSITFTYMS